VPTECYTKAFQNVAVNYFQLLFCRDFAWLAQPITSLNLCFVPYLVAPLLYLLAPLSHFNETSDASSFANLSMGMFLLFIFMGSQVWDALPLTEQGFRQYWHLKNSSSAFALLMNKDKRIKSFSKAQIAESYCYMPPLLDP
jgi:hypothetical protein